MPNLQKSRGLKLLLVSLCMLPSLLMSRSAPQEATPSASGITFVNGSSSKVIVERNGQKYLVDVAARTVTEVKNGESSSSRAGGEAVAQSNPPAQAAKPATPAPGASTEDADIYKAGDDMVFSVPTGRRPVKHGMYINFTHRFPYEAAFSGPARGATLLGLDDFAIPAFGVRYGVTDKFSVFAYRAPSVIGRPIELM